MHWVSQTHFFVQWSKWGTPVILMLYFNRDVNKATICVRNKMMINCGVDGNEQMRLSSVLIIFPPPLLGEWFGYWDVNVFNFF